jgi:hypothetical protein
MGEAIEVGRVKLTAYTHFGLGVALFAMSLLASGVWQVVIFVTAAVFLLSSILLRFVNEWLPNRLAQLLITVPVGHLTIFLGLIALAIALIEKGQVILGGVVIAIAYFGLLAGIGRAIVLAHSESR